MATPNLPFNLSMVRRGYRGPQYVGNVPFAQNTQQIQHLQTVQHIDCQLQVAPVPIQQAPAPDVAQLLACLDSSSNSQLSSQVSPPSRNSSSSRHRSTSSSGSLNTVIFVPPRVLAVLAFPPLAEGFEQLGIRKMHISYPNLFHWIYLPPPEKPHPGLGGWSQCRKVVCLIAAVDYPRLQEFCKNAFGNTPADWSVEPQYITVFKDLAADNMLLELFGQLVYLRRNEAQVCADYLWWPGQITGPECHAFRWAVLETSGAARQHEQDLSPCVEVIFGSKMLAAVKCRASSPQRGFLVVQHFVKSRSTEAHKPSGGLQTQPYSMPTQSQFQLMPSLPSPCGAVSLDQGSMGQQYQTIATTPQGQQGPVSRPTQQPGVLMPAHGKIHCRRKWNATDITHHTAQPLACHPEHVDGQPPNKKHCTGRPSSVVPQHSMTPSALLQAWPDLSIEQPLTTNIDGTTLKLQDDLVTPDGTVSSATAPVMAKGSLPTMLAATPPEEGKISPIDGAQRSTGPRTTEESPRFSTDPCQNPQAKFIENEPLSASHGASIGEEELLTIPGMAVLHDGVSGFPNVDIAKPHGAYARRYVASEVVTSSPFIHPSSGLEMLTPCPSPTPRPLMRH